MNLRHPASRLRRFWITWRWTTAACTPTAIPVRPHAIAVAGVPNTNLHTTRPTRTRDFSVVAGVLDDHTVGRLSPRQPATARGARHLRRTPPRAHHRLDHVRGASRTARVAAGATAWRRSP